MPNASIAATTRQRHNPSPSCTYPSTNPAVAMPLPPSMPLLFLISFFAMWPVITAATAAINGMRNHETIPDIRLMIASVLVVGEWGRGKLGIYFGPWLSPLIVNLGGCLVFCIRARVKLIGADFARCRFVESVTYFCCCSNKAVVRVFSSRPINRYNPSPKAYKVIEPMPAIQ